MQQTSDRDMAETCRSLQSLWNIDVLEHEDANTFEARLRDPQI